MRTIFLVVLVAVFVVAGCSSTPKAIPPTNSGPDYTLQLQQLNQAIAALNTKMGQVEVGVNTTTQAVQGLTTRMGQVEAGNTSFGQRVGQLEQANSQLAARVGQTEAGLQAQQQATTQIRQSLEQGLQGLRDALGRVGQAPSTVTPPQVDVNSSQGVVNPPPSETIMAGPTAYLAHVGERPTDWLSSSLAVWIKDGASFYLSLTIENRPVNFIILRGGLRNPAGEALLPSGQTAWLLVERTGRFSLVAEGWELNPATNQLVYLGRATATLVVDSASGGGGYSFEAFQFHQ